MFVALDLPDRARDSIAAFCESFTAGREGLRPVVPGQLHVTLVFLGWQDESAAERIALGAFRAAAGFAPVPLGAAGSEPVALGGAAGSEPPSLRARAVRAVPPRRPRLLALDLDDEGGRCVALHAAVSGALSTLGVYRPEERPFWPHITLARVKRGTRFTLSTEEAQDVNHVAPGAPFETSELTLYRSTLRPQGALYEPLARFALTRPGRVSFRPEAELQPAVRQAFAEHSGLLRALLPEGEVEHVGATSVPGSLTKGDLDLLVRVSREGFEAAVASLRGQYAIHQPENWNENYASFEHLGDTPLPVGIQLAVSGSPDDLMFARLRALLAERPELLECLNALKRSHEGSSYEAYTDAKGELIESLLDDR